MKSSIGFQIKIYEWKILDSFVIFVQRWRFEFVPERISPASVSDYAIINHGYTEELDISAYVLQKFGQF